MKRNLLVAIFCEQMPQTEHLQPAPEVVVLSSTHLDPLAIAAFGCGEGHHETFAPQLPVVAIALILGIPGERVAHCPCAGSIKQACLHLLTDTGMPTLDECRQYPLEEQVGGCVGVCRRR